MKFVRTARGYQALTLEDGSTLTGKPVEVSNEEAEKLVKYGEDAGVAVLVVDSEDDEAVSRMVTSRTPDLEAGISFATGKGDPVLSPGTDQADEADNEKQEK